MGGDYGIMSETVCLIILIIAFAIFLIAVIGGILWVYITAFNIWNDIMRGGK